MQSKIGKYIVNYFNEEEFHSIRREIFTNNSYYFESDNPTPYIIDIGTYIGISVLYFKDLYPNSKILCFEPNPMAIDLLKENILINNIQNVDIHDSAILIKDGIKDLYIDNTNLDRFSIGSFNKNCWNGSISTQKITVNTENLTKYIKTSVDLLKMDVEGSEQEILGSIKKDFGNIKNIIFEYHPTKNQNLNKILNLLSSNYDIEIYDNGRLLKRNIPTNKLLTIKAIYKH
ncbi:MAG: FkbM family methyltransferase [Candidatus Dojkabacteria bacterium]|nr:FkbM family methyltransferase [Candidatus Dojkabacteria bacterium]